MQWVPSEKKEQNLLRRAWDALDTFKQAYPENWHDDDQQVMHDLLKADLDLSGVKREWQGLTDEDIKHAPHHMVDGAYHYSFKQGAEWADRTLKEKNT